MHERILPAQLTNTEMLSLSSSRMAVIVYLRAFRSLDEGRGSPTSKITVGNAPEIATVGVDAAVFLAVDLLQGVFEIVQWFLLHVEQSEASRFASELDGQRSAEAAAG